MFALVKKTGFATFLMAMTLLVGMGTALAEELKPASEEAATAPEIIASIDVTGNKAVETGAILERMRIRVGDTLDRKRISRDVRKLYATGFFKDVRVLGVVRSDGRHLTSEEDENPVNDTLEYDGLNEIKEKDLKQRRKLKPGHILN